MENIHWDENDIAHTPFLDRKRPRLFTCVLKSHLRGGTLGITTTTRKGTLHGKGIGFCSQREPRLIRLRRGGGKRARLHRRKHSGLVKSIYILWNWLGMIECFRTSYMTRLSVWQTKTKHTTEPWGSRLFVVCIGQVSRAGTPHTSCITVERDLYQSNNMAVSYRPELSMYLHHNHRGAGAMIYQWFHPPISTSVSPDVCWSTLWHER